MEGPEGEQGRPVGPPRGLGQASGTGTNTNDLRGFRQRLHGCFVRRADALFELCDALLAAKSNAPSQAHLSLEAVHRRGWGSLYAALSKGGADEKALLALRARESYASGGSSTPPVYAVDVSPWPRCNAECSSGRTYLYHPSRHSAGQPIVAGWAYQFVAGLSFERDSWVAPADARRVRSEEDVNEVAAEQVRGLAGRLPRQRKAPLFVFNAGYDPVRLQLGLEGCRAQVLVRLHSCQTFYAEPELPPERPVGRPPRHGAKFSCKDPST